MKVRDKMTMNVYTVSPGDSIRRISELMTDMRLRRFPVMEEGKLAGIVTDRDFRNATESSVVLTEKKYHEYLLDTIKVESIMTTSPRVIGPDADLKEAALMLVEMKVGGLPVVEDDHLMGIITETDLIKALVELLP
ncbi:MAG: CBS domain-containing protein [Actinobacteria bacterium]|nr:CBS domain-containing protein [Actinomycetota bacterium]